MARGASTFLFADLAGFTALTEAQGSDAGAEVASRFSQLARLELEAHGAEEVKTIGDAVLVRAGEAEQATRLGLRLVDRVAQGEGLRRCESA